MRHLTAALVMASGLVLTACSSDGTDPATADRPTPSSTAAQSVGAATAPSPAPTSVDAAAAVPPDEVRGLVLTAADFPEPYTFTELPPGALERGQDTIRSVLEGATFTPSVCGQAAKLGLTGDLTTAGVAVATDRARSSTVTAVVAPATGRRRDLRGLADVYSTFRYTVAGPDGQRYDAAASLESLPAPAVTADFVQAARVTVVVSTGSAKQTVVTTFYSAAVRGVAVVVTELAPSPSPRGDDVLEQLLTIGLAKVAAY